MEFVYRILQEETERTEKATQPERNLEPSQEAAKAAGNACGRASTSLKGGVNQTSTQDQWKRVNLAQSLRVRLKKSQQERKMRRQFSSSLGQTKTSPLPQPQSNFTAQKGRPFSPTMARARLSTSSVKGTSMMTSIRAAPRTAMPASNSKPQKTSNQGRVAAMLFNRMGLLTMPYSRTRVRNAEGS